MTELDIKIKDHQINIHQFVENINRVRRLFVLYELLTKNKKGRKNVSEMDILRSAVVLTHATFEDLLRTLALKYLPRSSEEYLDNVPLVGTSNNGRPVNYGLGKLAKHRGKTIDTVIEESVAKYLDKLSFNNEQDVVNILKALSLDIKPFKKYMAQISSLMKRRHMIVHRADKSEKISMGIHSTNSISLVIVSKWIDTVQQFGLVIISGLIKLNKK